MSNIIQPFGIQSTAGAVPVLNEKGEVSMKKVKVHRYISGKKPDYAQGLSSDNDSDVDDFIEHQKPERRQQTLPQIINEPPPVDEEKELADPRLKRLRATKVEPGGRRPEHVPEVIEAESSESEHEQPVPMSPAVSDESEGELDDEQIEKRRMLLKQKLAAREADTGETLGHTEDDDFLGVEPKVDSSDEEDEYTDSEEETGPRVKPVFVRASERASIKEREKAARQAKREEADSRREKEERRRTALQLVEQTIKAEQMANKGDTKEGNINDVNTDDENDELEYEAWKLREMKRIKRDKEEREALEKELLEIERLRNLTEEERRIELRMNPKQVTNKGTKGKYKFLQKYYHRGAFYLDREEEVLKQDFSNPTLDDHFDKRVLPKVMQVKKFGRSGRTKYTHLVDQDTTQFDSPWTGENLPSTTKHRGGMKQQFERPSAKRSYT